MQAETNSDNEKDKQRWSACRFRPFCTLNLVLFHKKLQFQEPQSALNSFFNNRYNIFESSCSTCYVAQPRAIWIFNSQELLRSCSSIEKPTLALMESLDLTILP